MRVYDPTTKLTRLERSDYTLTGLEVAGDAAEAAKMCDQLHARIRALAASKITAGFQSTALGDAYWYDSTLEDQQNLQGVVSLGTGFSYPTRQTQLGAKTRRSHTAEQLRQVLADGATIKQNILVQCDALKAFVSGRSLAQLQVIYAHFSEDDYIWALV